MATEAQLNQVISLVRSAGFEPAGYTDPRLLGEVDGKEIITSPRKRYVKPYTNIRVTVGLQVIFFYTVDHGEVTQLQRFNTIHVKDIAKYLKKL